MTTNIDRISQWAPLVLMLLGGGALYGTLRSEQEHIRIGMDRQQATIYSLASVPLQISEMRRHVEQSLAELKLAGAGQDHLIRQQMASIEAISKRNAENLITIWPRLRELEQRGQKKSEQEAMENRSG